MAHADTKDNIMREARSMEGWDYGKGPGLTCSEYTRLVFGRARGVHVWMPSWDNKQWAYGRYLGRPQRPERGALVFFDENGPGGDSITHVGVADGQGGVWQSSSYYGYVMHLYDMDWIEGRYVGARRIR
jgi:hypothetical protein